MSRPVFLNLLQIKFPVTAIISIAHRISGVAIFLAMPFIYLWFFLSLESDSSFNFMLETSKNIYVALFYWLIVTALLVHIVAGIRHLLFDFSDNHSLARARTSAWISFGLIFLISVYYLVTIIF